MLIKYQNERKTIHGSYQDKIYSEKVRNIEKERQITKTAKEMEMDLDRESRRLRQEYKDN